MSVQAGGAGVVLASDTFATNAVEPSGGSQTGGGNLDDAGPLRVSDTIFTNGIGSTTEAIARSSAASSSTPATTSSRPRPPSVG